MDSDGNRLSARLGEIGARLDMLMARLDRLADALEGVVERLGDHEARLQLLEDHDRRRGGNWDRVISVGLAVVQAALIALVLGRLGG